MAELKCQADSCVYNKSECCCKGDICVGGKQADCTEKTCCESYADKKRDSYESAIEHACKVIDIDCEAVKCIYNSNYKCNAKKVDILGNGAVNSQGTACGTFKEQNN